MILSGRTRLLGVIGHPVGHTLSPRMHNAASAASGLDYVYLPMDVRPVKLPAAVSGLRALGFRGFNVTMAHKEAILPLLDELDETARAAGAVNTVTIEERGMRCSNTVGSGFVEACASSGLTFARVPLDGVWGGRRHRSSSPRGGRRGGANTQPEPVARREAAGRAALGVPGGRNLGARRD
jgi:shikimate dehydrogenase